MGLGDARSAVRAARTVSSGAMGCPNCGGTLELAAPDKTERVTCPYCNSLLDVNQGNLAFLKTLEPSPAPFDFIAPIGAEGALPQAVRQHHRRRLIGRASVASPNDAAMEGVHPQQRHPAVSPADHGDRTFGAGLQDAPTD